MTHTSVPFSVGILSKYNKLPPGVTVSDEHVYWVTEYCTIDERHQWEIDFNATGDIRADRKES